MQRKYNSSSTLQGETLAVRLAGQLLESNNISNAIIENDNRTVIHLCSTENVPPRATIIDDIKKLAESFNFSLAWVHRDCNRAAHWVATSCLN